MLALREIECITTTVTARPGCLVLVLATLCVALHLACSRAATTALRSRAATAPTATRSCPPYDPINAPCLSSFDPIKSHALCPFAKRAKLWGGARVAGTLEARVAASAQRFCEFARDSARIGVDGFVFEDDKTESTLASHAMSTLRVLVQLSALDPSGMGCLAQPGDVVGRTWRFRWNCRYFFVTSFGACYPPSHPRHTFGAQSTFVLIQPGESFTRWRVTPSVKTRIYETFAARDCAVFYQKATSAQIIVPPIAPIIAEAGPDGPNRTPPALVHAAQDFLRITRASCMRSWPGDRRLRGVHRTNPNAGAGLHDGAGGGPDIPRARIPAPRYSIVLTDRPHV
jgi:hypothetical protein